HYFEILEKPPSDLATEELSRIPELIAVMAGLGPFISKTGERLSKALVNTALSGFRHYQIANALAALASNAALYEEFERIEAWGVALETRIAADPAVHKDCCGGALSRLLPTNLAERIIERSLERRDDMAWQRGASILLRFMGTLAVEK